MGTPHEVNTALSALDSTGSLEGISRPERLYGADTGRIRRYARVRIPITTTTRTTARAGGNRPQPKAAGATQQPLTLPDAA